MRYCPDPGMLTNSIDVFFTHAPLMPRMIHRPSLMSRLRLPPTHPRFPHASLLHSICAFASTLTAWVTSIPPEMLQEAIETHKETIGSLDGIADFGLAQATAAQTSISLATHSTIAHTGQMLVEICQASVSPRSLRTCIPQAYKADHPHRHLLCEKLANAGLDSGRYPSSHFESARNYE
jgi:hypothetical protein